jgi:hypothetical protein
MKKELFRIECVDNCDKYVLENAPINEYGWGEVIARLAKKYPDASTIDHMGECEFDDKEFIDTELLIARNARDDAVNRLKDRNDQWYKKVEETNKLQNKYMQLKHSGQIVMSELKCRTRPKMKSTGIIFKKCEQEQTHIGGPLELITVDRVVRSAMAHLEELLRES